MIDIITVHRVSLAGALSTLTAGQWRGPSLCAGWTPAHVLAHQTMPFRVSEPEFMAGLRSCGGDFTRYSDEVAERDSALPPTQLIAALHDNAGNPWSPPGGGLRAALSHDVIHGLDMTWLLGLDYEIPDAAMTSVLGMIASPGGRTLFGFPLDGVSVRATDLDWSHGEGAELSGRGRDLLPLLAGRAIPRELFHGDGVALAFAQATP